MIVNVVKYQQGWAELYQEEKCALLNTLGEMVCKVHHIGSTAVKGLAAKPIIDIMIEVDSLTKLDAASGFFEEMGYEAMGSLALKGGAIIARVEIIEPIKFMGLWLEIATYKDISPFVII